MQELLQLLDVERIWIGISAQAVVLAHTNRATVMLTVTSACKTMCVVKTTALISGVMHILMLIAVSQVIYLHLCKTRVKLDHFVSEHSLFLKLFLFEKKIDLGTNLSYKFQS